MSFISQIFLLFKRRKHRGRDSTGSSSRDTSTDPPEGSSVASWRFQTFGVLSRRERADWPIPEEKACFPGSGGLVQQMLLNGRPVKASGPGQPSLSSGGALRALQPRSPSPVIWRWQTPGHPAGGPPWRTTFGDPVTSGSAGRLRTEDPFMGPEPLVAEEGPRLEVAIATEPACGRWA